MLSNLHSVTDLVRQFQVFLLFQHSELEISPKLVSNIKAHVYSPYDDPCICLDKTDLIVGIGIKANIITARATK